MNMDVTKVWRQSDVPPEAMEVAVQANPPTGVDQAARDEIAELRKRCDAMMLAMDRDRRAAAGIANVQAAAETAAREMLRSSIATGEARTEIRGRVDQRLRAQGPHYAEEASRNWLRENLPQRIQDELTKEGVVLRINEHLDTVVKATIDAIDFDDLIQKFLLARLFGEGVVDPFAQGVELPLTKQPHILMFKSQHEGYASLEHEGDGRGVSSAFLSNRDACHDGIRRAFRNAGLMPSADEVQDGRMTIPVTYDRVLETFQGAVNEGNYGDDGNYGHLSGDLLTWLGYVYNRNGHLNDHTVYNATRRLFAGIRRGRVNAEGAAKIFWNMCCNHPELFMECYRADDQEVARRRATAHRMQRRAAREAA
jgi:hypothetical protein